MDNLGGSYRFWGFWCRIHGKVSLLGVSAKIQSWLRLRLMGITLGGSYRFWGLRFLHLTAFLLFALNTRVLTSDIGFRGFIGFIVIAVYNKCVGLRSGRF